MLKDALVFLSDLATSAATPFEVSNIGGKREIFNSRTGEVKWVDVPVVVTGTVDTVADIANAASNHVWMGENQSIWVSKSSVSLILNNHKPMNRFTMRLTPHPAIEILKRCSGPHKAVIQILRNELASIDVWPEDLIASLSSLKFEVNSETNSVVRRGDESLGKTVKAKVTGELNIPELARFKFGVFPELDINTESSLDCSVVVDSQSATISITPLPGEIEQMMVQAQDRVADSIRMAIDNHDDIRYPIPVYCGTYCN